MHFLKHMLLMVQQMIYMLDNLLTQRQLLVGTMVSIYKGDQIVLITGSELETIQVLYNFLLEVMEKLV